MEAGAGAWMPLGLAAIFPFETKAEIAPDNDTDRR